MFSLTLDQIDALRQIVDILDRNSAGSHKEQFEMIVKSFEKMQKFIGLYVEFGGERWLEEAQASSNKFNVYLDSFLNN